MSESAWRKQNFYCWLCGAPHNLELHHMARGIHRAKAVKDPSTWFRACGRCHEQKLHGTPKFSYALQLGLKMLHDPVNYDRQKCNIISSVGQPTPDRVTERDVAEALHDAFQRYQVYIPQ